MKHGFKKIGAEPPQSGWVFITAMSVRFKVRKTKLKKLQKETSGTRTAGLEEKW